MKINVKQTTKTTNSIVIIPIKPTDLTSSQFKNFTKKEVLSKKIITAFSAKKSSHLLLSGKQTEQIILVGLGDQPTYKSIKYAFRKFAVDHKKQLSAKLTLNLGFTEMIKDAHQVSMLTAAAVNGLKLSTYDIGLYKTNDKTVHPLAKSTSTLNILVDKKFQEEVEQAAFEGAAKANTQLSIMDLVNAPGNKAIPEVLGKWAINSGKRFGYKTTVFSKKKIINTGLHALLAVNRGSEYSPAFVIMEYKPKNVGKKKLPKVGLVGKGVTFDTGGISIKGHQNMHYMKSDMGGAAAVLGAMELTAKLQLPVHLIGIVPATDNCVDATAVKPGDVINSYSGKTIEIIDTDAEGRLILADGLAYLNKNFKPDIMLDLATLTGSSVRTFGYQCGAAFSKDEQLIAQLTAAGNTTGERIWPLPLWDEYQSHMDSDVADIKNFSGRPIAGAISAAKFLEFFTSNHPRWAHLDIAGVAFGDTGFSKQKSATGYGVGLLVEFLKNLAK